MKFKRIFFFSFSLLFCLFLTRYTAAQTLDDLLKQGDDALDVSFNLSGAAKIYQKADSLYPDNWKVFWRLSRVYVYEAEKLPDKTDEQKDAQLKIYKKAFTYADTAVKLAPDMSVTYLRRAIANGKIALFKGVFSVASVVNAVKADCEKAIGLANGGSYVQALAHYVLARTNAKVSEKWAPARAILGLGWADLDKAIAEYNIAVKLYPNFRMFYVDLGKAYIRNDEYAKAREVLKKAVDSPKRDLNDDSQLAEAKELLEKIRNE